MMMKIRIINSIVLVLAMSLACQAQVTRHEVKLRDFTRLSLLDDINVNYRCNADSAGLAVITCTQEVADHLIFSINNNGRLSIQVDDAFERQGNLPTITLYSKSLDEARDFHYRVFGKILREKLDADTRKLYDSIIKDKNKSLVERAQLIVDTFDDVAQNNTPLRKLVNLNKDYLAALNLIETRKGEVQQVFDKDNLFNSRKEYLEKQADVLNLLSYEQFNELSVIEQNSKENRDAAILEAMLKIASSDLVLEETLSRSNCDDIIEARDDMMSQAEKNRRKARSPYNFFDQARYQEECMNGAILKAFSVSRDTFCSICNKVHANLNKSFNVIYFEEDGFNEKELKKHYDIVKKRTVNGKKAFVVSHNQIGWSKDDLNVLGKYITVYTSETTAYHLDAVKLGGIPNLNTLTFGVYKTFVDCGSDFKTAVGFIMQPAIKRIVDAYDKSRSIFDKDFNNVYVDTAIKAIARKLGLKYNDIPITNYTSIEDVIQAFNNK